MAVTISLYNQTARVLQDGYTAGNSELRLLLFTAAVYDATDSVIADVSGTEVLQLYGYVTGGRILINDTILTVDTNDAMLDADDVSWSAVGGSITASYGILAGSSNKVLAFIDFGGSQSAGTGTDFLVSWSTNGIFKWTVA